MFGWLRRRLRSTTTRFVILAFLVQLPVTGGALWFAQQQSERALLAEQQQWVDELRRELLAVHARSGRDGLATAITERLKSVRGDLAVILLAGPDGVLLAGNIGAWPPVVPDEAPWRTIDLYRVGSERPEHMGVSAMLLPDGSRLLTGRVIDTGVRFQQIDEEAMAAAAAIGLLLAMLSALLLSRVVSRQVDQVVSATIAIREGALDRRIPVQGSGDAFDALAAAINAMLDRIQTLVSELRLTTDGLAHDLRSPITRLKTRLERAIIETSDPQACAALESVAGEAEALLDMLSTALLISRTQAGIGRENLAELELLPLLSDLAEVYGPVAEERGFVISVDAPSGLTARLHRQLISQAIGNLIENALHYAHGGHRVSLTARDADGMLELAVADDGPGIPAARRPEAMRRFGRLDPARGEGGSGLGLSLVDAVARMHGGEALLEDNDPGLCVRLRLGR